MSESACLQRAIEILEKDLEMHYQYESLSMQEGMYHALDLLREAKKEEEQ